jgi:capsule polysaccharide modification protein KpsS
MILLNSFGSPWMNKFIALVSRILKNNGHSVVIAAWDERAGHQLRDLGCRNVLNMIDLYLRSDLPAEDDDHIRELLGFTWKPGTSSPFQMPPGYEEHKISRAQLASVSIRFALKMLNPSTVVIWNNLSFGGKLFDEYAREYGAQRYYIERGPLPGTIQFSERGVNADLQLATDGDKFVNESAVVTAADWMDAYKRREQRSWGEIASTAEPRQSIQQVKGERPIVLFIAQVAYDTQIVWHSPYGYNYPSVYDELERLYSYDTSDYQLAIKLHPVVVHPELHLKASMIKGVPMVYAGDIRDYLEDEKVERVVTVNSSVGFEALLYGKQVYTLGKNWYTGLTEGRGSLGDFLMKHSDGKLRAAERVSGARDLLASGIALGEFYRADAADAHIIASELDDADDDRRGIAANDVCAALNGE